MDDNAESPISDEQRLLPSDARTRKTSEQGRFLNALTATNDPSLMLTTLRMLEHQDDLDGFREGVRMLEALAENRALTPETVDILLRLSTKLDLDLEFDLASCERMTIEQQVHLAALGDGHVQWALAHNQFVVAEALVVIAGSCTEVRLAEQVLNNPNVSTAVRDAESPRV